MELSASEEICDLTLNITSQPFKRKNKQEKKVAQTRQQRIKDCRRRKFDNNDLKVPLKHKGFSEFDSGLESIDNSEQVEGNRQTHSNSKQNFNEKVEITKNSEKVSFKKPSKRPTHKTIQSHQQKKQQIVSSLFHSNPEIPHIVSFESEGKKDVLFSEKSFADLDLHPYLVSGLKSHFDITSMTKVQEGSIPVLLDEKDALIKSCTGSGKTLAYAIPIVQRLQSIKPNIQRCDGVFALVILPTRELVLQSYDCFSKLTKAFNWIVPGYLIGGEKKKSEKSRIRKGINILVSTPGRLLDHLDNTINLNLKSIQWLVVDEADRLLEQGFEEAVLKIVTRCSSMLNSAKRQTILLSATLSKGVEKLAGISMTNPTYINLSGKDVGDEEMASLVVPSQLKQYIIIVPTKLRLVTISAFIVDKCAKSKIKALIFMCTQDNVNFHFELFNNDLKGMLKSVGDGIKFFKLHGNMKQEDRTEIFRQFRAADSGILLCTEVAARGLDLPLVDWIIQYNVPTSVESYVHRVGRTARIGKEGQSLLFLIPTELEFINLLQAHQLNVQEIYMEKLMESLPLLKDSTSPSKQRNQSKTPEMHATDLQLKFEETVYAEKSLHSIAKEAFLSFIRSYSSYPKPLRSVLQFKALHLGHLAKSFCLRESPSELGCRFAQSHTQRPQSRENTKNSQKRKLFNNVSEFDSGLNLSNEDKQLQMKKKRKTK